jgi:prolyl oligopeptidase
MSGRRLSYPHTRKADIVEKIHGVDVADPYRWLEQPDDSETIAWVDAQNALTKRVLDRPRRKTLVERLTTLLDYPRSGPMLKRGPHYFVTHNSGLQDQPVLYVAEQRDGPWRVLLDPNALSADGTVALTGYFPSDDGALLAYALSSHGSDRQDILIRDVRSGVDRQDLIRWAKFVTLAWLPDGSGFYYTRFPEPGTVPDGDENYFCSVWFHALGQPQSAGTRIFDAPDRRETVFDVDLSDDGRWVVITAQEGASDRSEIFIVDRAEASHTPRLLFRGFKWAWHFVEAARGRLYFRTDADAPRGRIIAVDPATPDDVIEIVAESAHKLEAAIVAGGQLVLAYLRNASAALNVVTLDGVRAGEIEMPGLGSLTGLNGRPGDSELLVGYTSFTQAPSNYVCELPSTSLQRIADPTGGAASSSGASVPDASNYETRQVWYPSRDGTQVSMFLVHRRDLRRDGDSPVLLTGYGGFNISLTPAFDPSNFVFLEAGGVYAVANLRGGGEYGEAWHEAGMLGRKQNVFDDFIAAAEWLVASGYTRAGRIAIEGGSNGGLLTGAVMLQRPNLFGAVVCRVPVADMLRYHLFTVGRFWIPEYGSADDPDQFEWLYRYSPYHNVQDEVRYPPILITTADTDDRVSPGMAKKFAARLQAAAGNQSPVLIRIETKAGHGAGKPITKIIEEDADIFTFVMEALDGSL